MGKPTFNCTKCPGFCCNYEHIPVNKRDLKRLAKHFDLPLEKAELRFTKVIDGELGMRPKIIRPAGVCKTLVTVMATS